ncbi:hypothetical protein SGPA1_30182 [Streptomyces misionensis JCM 4497]
MGHDPGICHWVVAAVRAAAGSGSDGSETCQRPLPGDRLPVIVESPHRPEIHGPVSERRGEHRGADARADRPVPLRPGRAARAGDRGAHHHRGHRDRADPAHRPRSRAARPAAADAAPGGLRRTGRRRRVRHRRHPAPPHLGRGPRAGPRRQAPAHPGPAARLGRRGGLHQPLRRRRGEGHPVRRRPRHARGQRVGGLPLLRPCHGGRQEPAHPAGPQRPPRPPGPAQDGPAHLAHHHQRQAAAVPSGVPAAHRAGAGSPGVRGGHGLRGRPDHRGRLGGLPGAVAPGGARAPAEAGRGHAQPERGTGAAVAGPLAAPRVVTSTPGDQVVFSSSPAAESGRRESRAASSVG